jgi:beta-phosphoglucomutase
MPGAVLWDLDGTLVDSEEYHWEAWRDTMAAEGRPITHDEFLETFGWRNDDIIARWLGEDLPWDRVSDIGDRKEVAYRAMVRKRGLKPSPGAADCVKALTARGWLQAIASSAPRRNIEVVLAALGMSEDFQAVVAAEDVERGKPDPDVFLVGASRLGIAPPRCIVVEDAPAGIEAAGRAGMHSIGLSRNDVPLGAELTVRSLEHLPIEAFEALIGD